MAWLIAAGILAFVLIILAAQVEMTRMAQRMIVFTPPLNAPETEVKPGAESVSFPTSDGLTLNGAIFEPDQKPRGLIVFCHEFGGCRWSAPEYLETLIDAGFAVFSFDFRGQGDSAAQEGYEPFHWVTEFEVEDLRAAFRYVESRPDLSELPLGLFGVSRGGGTALSVAGEFANIKVIACESAYSAKKMMNVFAIRWQSLFGPSWISHKMPRWHSRFTIACARQITSRRKGCRFVHLEALLGELRDRSVLLISGKRDNYVCSEIAEFLVEQIGGEKAELWIVPKARHNRSRDAAREEYDQRLRAHFDQLDGGLDNAQAISEMSRDESLAGR